MKLKDTPWKKSYDKPRQHIKKQRHHFTNKDLDSQKYGFSSSHVWMWVLDRKEGWALKDWCFWTVLLEKTLESPLDSKEIKSINPKRYQHWIFIGRTDAEAPKLWPPDTKSQFTGKDSEGKMKGATEGKVVGCHHWLNGHEFEQAPGLCAVQGSLACCSLWGCKMSDMTEQLSWTELICILEGDKTNSRKNYLKK